LVNIVCQRSYKSSKNSSWNDKKEYKIELEREVVKEIWRVEREFYNGTSLSNTRLEQRNKSKGKYIGLYYEKSVVNEVWRWKVEASD